MGETNLAWAFLEAPRVLLAAGFDASNCSLAVLNVTLATLLLWAFISSSFSRSTSWYIGVHLDVVGWFVLARWRGRPNFGLNSCLWSSLDFDSSLELSECKVLTKHDNPLLSCLLSLWADFVFSVMSSGQVHLPLWNSCNPMGVIWSELHFSQIPRDSSNSDIGSANLLETNNW